MLNKYQCWFKWMKMMNTSKVANPAFTLQHMHLRMDIISVNNSKSAIHLSSNYIRCCHTWQALICHKSSYYAMLSQQSPWQNVLNLNCQIWTCTAILYCNFVLQFCTAILYCNFVLKFCIAILYCNTVLQFCTEILRFEFQ